MGWWSKVKDKVKSGYTSIDKAVGGYLPGGVSPGSSSSSSGSSSSGSSSSGSSSSSSSTSTSTSSRTSSGGSSGGSSSSSSSGGSSSSSINKILNPKGTYDVSTNTYTSPEGYKQSMTLSNAQNIGASISLGSSTTTKNLGGSSSSSSSSSSGSNLAPKINLSNSGGSTAPATPQPNSISAYNPLDYAKRPYDPYEDMSFKEKTGSVINKFTSKNFWSDVGSDFSYAPFTGVKTLVSPFFTAFSHKKVGDIKSPDLPYQGTLIFNPKTNNFDLPDQYKGKTGWEIMQRDAQDAELAKFLAETGTVNELTPKYQGLVSEKAQGYQAQINTGSLTVEQAESKLKLDVAELQKNFSSEAQIVYTNRLTSNPMYKDWGKDFNRYNKKIINEDVFLTGALVGASLVGGLPAIVASGAVGVEGAFTTGRGIQEKNYVKAGIGVTMFALGTYGAVRGTANYMTQQNVKNVLSVKPKEVYSTRYTKGDYSYDLYSSVQQTSNAYSKTTGIVVGKMGQGNNFQIVGGRSNTYVYTKDVWTGRDLIVGGSQKIGSTTGSFYPELAKAGFTPSAFKLSTTTRYDFYSLADKTGTFSKLSGNFYPGGSGKTVTDLYRGLSKPGGTIKLSKGVYYQGDDSILSLSEKIKDIPKLNYIQGQGFKAYDVGKFKEEFFKFKSIDNIGYTLVKDPSKFSRSIYFDPTPSNLGYPPSGFASGGSAGGSSVVNALQSQAPVLAPSFAKSATAFTSSSVQATGGAGALASIVSTGSTSIVETQQKPTSRNFSLISPQLVEMPKMDTQTMQVVTTIPVVRSGNAQKFVNMPTQIQLPRMDQMPRLDQIQIQKPGLVNPLTFATPGVGTPNFGYDFKLPPFLLDLPSGMDVGGLGKRRVKIKKVVKYTPSYSAIVFNIRGKAPKGTETGLRVRPIPKGTDNLFNLFSGKTPEFYNPFQMPKVRRRRIIKRKVKRR